MSRKARERMVVFGRVKSGELSRAEGAALLGLSLRQMHRSYPRWVSEGDEALLHRSRGRVSPRGVDASSRDKGLAAYREHYLGFGPTLAAEKLGECHGVWVSHDTVRRWLIAEGLMEKGRRGRRSRRRRQRRSRFGQMLQMDGSPHAWLEGRGPACVLMTAIDDATGRRRGKFFTGETLMAAMETFGLWCGEFGVPESLYVDRHGIYRSDRDPTLEELKRGKRPVTQFGRAMKELEVGLILARSPQAKGRVERSNGVLQDRLVKELRLAKIGSIEAANAWLAQSGFWETLDGKFEVAAKEDADAHRPLTVALEEVLCVKEVRSVGLDGCVSYAGRVLQLEGVGKLKRVEVRQVLDGSLVVMGGGRRLNWREMDVPSRRADQAAARKSKRGPIRNNKKHKPTAAQRFVINNRTPGHKQPAPGLRKVG